jgi:hypothetical protein
VGPFPPESSCWTYADTGANGTCWGNGRAVASGRPFDRQPDARGKRAVVDSGRPRHRAEGTPQPCLRVTGAISSAVHPPCRSDCVVRTLKLGPVRPVRPAITARLRHRVSFTGGRSFQPRAVAHHMSAASQKGPLQSQFCQADSSERRNTEAMRRFAMGARRKTRRGFGASGCSAAVLAE